MTKIDGCLPFADHRGGSIQILPKALRDVLRKAVLAKVRA